MEKCVKAKDNSKVALLSPAALKESKVVNTCIIGGMGCFVQLYIYIFHPLVFTLVAVDDVLLKGMSNGIYLRLSDFLILPKNAF